MKNLADMQQISLGMAGFMILITENNILVIVFLSAIF